MPAAPPPESAEPALLDFEQALAHLATTRPTLARWLRSGQVTGMKVGRQWRFYRQDLDRFLRGESPRVGLPVAIEPLLDALTARLLAAGGAVPARAGGAPVAGAVDLMVRLGAALRAGSLHLEPAQDGEARTARLRYRIDGALHPAASFDLRLLPAVVEQWKRLAGGDPRETAAPQDGRVRFDLGGGGGRLDLVVGFLPALLGEALVARYVPSTLEVELALPALGLAAGDQARLERAARAPWGLVVVTGPTGCGKTTTLYAGLNRAVGPQVKALSAESPVECVLPGVVQVAVNERAGLGYPRVLRGILHNDPDVILVGEIRDAETALLTLRAALTGHLVFTALHTEDAASALTRLADVAGDAYVVADAVKLVVAQRLVRRLCPGCAAPAIPAGGELAEAHGQARAGGVEPDRLPAAWRAAVGCARCGSTGYRGRLVVAETLETNPELAALVRRGAPPAEVRAAALRHGMISLAAHAVQRAAAGETTLGEALALGRR
ncbi:MAG: Flp pilus assembly complex ATPase component TadA [Planctomycetes bacterium]|nr:Flp pilus assembly complex ATPase component TadA [Planctomycetota bacterium]